MLYALRTTHHALTDSDIHLFKQGSLFRLYDKLGAHPMSPGGRSGTRFRVWAPNAAGVSVIGDFNRWDPSSHRMTARQDGSGIWEALVAEVGPGGLYKYHIVSMRGDSRADRADPLAFRLEPPPRTASQVWNLDYEWHDQEWMERRAKASMHASPVSIYEVHLGSWCRARTNPSYRGLAPALADYVVENGFTHVELLPLMEHPFYGSWGYQVLGYFAPTSRYGTPQDLMYLIDTLHQAGIGVILDWVPAHFPDDPHGLALFDGTHLYEHADPRQGRHPDWQTCVFNYGRNEVRSFLVSSALFWLDKYHADGLRADAVASMLYLDYSRKAGEWVPNRYGGNENLEAIEFLRVLNRATYEHYPGIQTFAEESTAWPMVSRPVHLGGLGFGFKWNMGWMNDTLRYFGRDPVHRKYHQNDLTFSLWYAFTENFVLPLSHDEVVHGKGSLLARMPGDDWQKFAQLRLLLGWLYTHPGKKLLFMGGEFGAWAEWNHETGLDWHLLEHARHQGIKTWVTDLNRLYRSEPALYELDCSAEGFEWIDFSDAASSILSFFRRAASRSESPESGLSTREGSIRLRRVDSTTRDLVLVAANFTPVSRHDYRIGVPGAGSWHELLNSDAETYGGSGQGNFGRVESAPIPSHGRDHSLSLTLPPLAIVILKHNAAPLGP